MKKFLIIFTLLILIFGCEKIDIVESNIVYIEKTVVHAELFKDSVFTGVSFTRTLPLTDIYDIKKAELKDVVAYLVVDGIQVIPLHYTQDGVYIPLYKLIIKSGSTYELFADARGHSVYSVTKIPEIPVVQSTNRAEGNFLEADVIVNSGEVYGSSWVVFTSSLPGGKTSANNFHSIVGPSSRDPRFAFTRTIEIPEEYLTSYYLNNIFIQVYAFDKPYLDYFKTKDNNEPIDDSFAQGGGPINWNVRGENAIGLFIGIAKSNLIIAR